MTDVEKRTLILSYQEDYTRQTGEHLKVVPCSRWEAAASFSDQAEFWKIFKVLSDYTGWIKSETYLRSQTEEKVFRRGIIDFIAVNNGVNYSECARLTKRDHTTVIHSVRQFENRLDTELHVRRYFYEAVRYIKENYHIYKDQNITEESFT